MRRASENNSKFTCESCRKRVGMVIKEYGTGRWLCYDCHFRKGISKDARETLVKDGNKNV